LASAFVKKLVDSGIHFGHRTSRWNPKMENYIFSKRNLIHIIDIRETVKGILRAKQYLSRTVGKGQDVLFVGTKRQARNSIIHAAQQTGMPYVAERWLGGTLTNFRTIRSRLARLEELEKIQAEGMEGKYSKKMISTLNREYRKIKRNLEGIRNMNRLPGAIVLVDIKREYIAAREARKLRIPVIGLIDTDSDPDLVDIVIPGNDDAMRGIDLVLEALSEAILEGKRAQSSGDQDDAAGGARPGRRSSRVTARATEKDEVPESAEEVASTGQHAPQDAYASR
jgi:small subunit ribosomal protein S2